MTTYPCKTVLITNIETIHYGPLQLRLDAHALTIRDDSELNRGHHTERRRDLHGFGTSCAWSVFSMPIPTSEYTWDPQSRFLEIGPIKLLLHPQDPDRPVSFETIEGAYEPGAAIGDHNPWTVYCNEIARRVIKRTADYWTAPFMPAAVYDRPGVIREALLDRYGL